MALEDLTPSNRFELALSGDMTAEEASNRIEKILAGADIEPADRLEYFLKLRVSQGGGGGGEEKMPWLHYVGTVDILPSEGTPYTYELPLDIDINTVSGFIGIPHSLETVGNMPATGIPQVNDHYNKTPTDSAAHGFSDSESNFRYDAENKKIILYIGTWKGVFTGLMDICYMLKEE